MSNFILFDMKCFWLLYQIFIYSFRLLWRKQQSVGLVSVWSAAKTSRVSSLPLAWFPCAPTHLTASPVRFFSISALQLLPALQSRADWRLLPLLTALLARRGKLWLGLKETLGTGFQKKGEKASLCWNGCQLRNFLRNDKDSHCSSSLGVASTSNAASSVGEGSSWGLLRDWSWFGHQCCAGFIFRKLTLWAGNFYNCQETGHRLSL